jgi:phospholipase A1/A2
LPLALALAVQANPLPAPEAAASAPAAPSALLQGMRAKPETERSVFERRVLSEARSANEAFALLPHRPTLLMPLSYQRRQDDAAEARAPKALEALFQISFKFPLTRPLFGDRVIPYFAYTGRAWWQVYDGANSRPFREYNHEPELLLAMPGDGSSWWGWQYRLATLGLNHQSNGREVPASRSWNRVTAELLFDRKLHTWASLKLWVRLPEERKVEPTAALGDDNPDINRFMGQFELRLGHAQPDGHNLTLMLRQSTRSDGRGALQLDWSHPARFSPELRWTVHLFSGYGDSLIDYNRRVQRIGLGVMLSDWF